MTDISVIIPLYNKEAYVKRCLRSVLNQTLQPTEIIIVNDGSTDNSLRMATEIKDERIRIFTQENAGVSAARNRGVKEAKGTFIAFMDADDEWTPQHLAQLDALMQKYPGYNVYGTSYRIIKNGTSYLPNVRGIRFKTDDGVLTNYFQVCAIGESPVHIGSIMTTKEVFNDFVSFPVGVTSGEDIYTLACIMLTNDLVFSKSPDYILHVTPNDRISPTLNPVDTKFDQLLAIAPHKKHIRAFVASWHRRRMVNGILKKDARLFFSQFIKCVAFHPFQRKVYTTALITFYRSLVGKS